ncbi:hypothetical protein BV898_18593 [Hypsibius exemplaris]|uniref:DDE-1 domain-containing protein n=1 Tax=Hypsibius exemplaris TaxID=2072580 RepID=A0A9X6NJJ7_HYPEX|nr:hypothetical protein BV898_18593 [Hypsibius exemplaris]
MEIEEMELVIDHNGFPDNVSVTEEDVAFLDDRLDEDEPSSNEVFEPSSDKGNLARGSAESELAIIHDSDLTKRARDAASSANLSGFRVSKSWIRKFKKINNIVDQKFTEYVTRKMMDDKPERYIAAADFVDHVKGSISLYGPDCVLNADQSGFEYEIHSGRFLRTRGLKKVRASVKSISKMTHSYTNMVTIDATGKLLGPLFIVMQEITGDKFGPQVQQDLFVAHNILVTASNSGKMKKEHLTVWLEQVYFPHVGDRTVLVIDSWSIYKNRTLLDAANPEGREVQIVAVPPKTTSLCQPLDVYGFRTWKVLVQKIWDWVVRDNIQCELQQRNSILKLQSLARGVLCNCQLCQMDQAEPEVERKARNALVAAERKLLDPYCKSSVMIIIPPAAILKSHRRVIEKLQTSFFIL